MRFHALRFAVCQLLATGVVLGGTASAQAPLRPEPQSLELAPRELVDRLRANPIAYFRFVNRPWIERVCDVFADQVRDLPVVRLHGDAHIEQFAVTSGTWGLDDFDDSARGPALVDMVRFLGSTDLVARQRGWTADRHALFDRFFEGYRKGLADPDYHAPEPEIVGRLRARAPRSRAAFLAWGESQMNPMAAASTRAVIAGMDVVARTVHPERPDLPPGYLGVVRAGWLGMGVGSAVTPKVLIRIQGASASRDDDELLEAKQLRDLSGLSCLESPPADQPAVRVILGVQQIGRLKHNILVAGPAVVVPELVVRGRQLRDWWVRSWDETYGELSVDHLRSVKDLSAIVYDAGVQLGAGCLREEAGSMGFERRRDLASFAWLESRIRDEASRFVDQMLLGWKELGAR